MAENDNNDPLKGDTIEEKLSSLTKIIEESRDASTATKELIDLMEVLHKQIRQTEKPWEGWTYTLDQVKERMQELASHAMSLSDLNEDQLSSLEAMVLYNTAVEQASAKELGYKQEIENSLRQLLGMSQRLLSNSKLFTGFEIQRLKASSDILGPVGKQFNLLEGMRIKQAEIIKDLQENITKENALIILRAKSVQTITSATEKLYTAFMGNIKALAQIRAELNKLNTDTTDFAEVALEASQELGGVSLAEVGNTAKDLATNMSQFVDLTREEQKELTKTFNIIERLGVSISNQIQMFDALTKGLGMTNQQGQEALRSLESFGKRANIPMAVLDKNLGAVGTKLAAFGKEGYQKVFESLSVAAKNLAIDIGKLVQVTEQLTTFEGAAKMAGELNAVLGRNLVSSMGLLEASMRNPIEVFEQIKSAMDASGRSFDEMAPAMQRHIASIFGMEVTEAQRYFNMSLGEATAEMEHNAKTQAELAELAAKSADVFKRLEIAFQKIMSSAFVSYLTSVLEALASVVDFFTSSKNALSQFFSVILTGATIFVFVTLAIIKLKTAYTTYSTLLAISRGKEIAQQTLASRSMNADTAARYRNIRAIKAQQAALSSKMPSPIPSVSAGASALGFAKTLGILAVAILAVGGAMFIASKGFVPLIEAFSKAGTSARYARDAIIALTIGIVVASIVLAFASKALAAAGMGLLVFGAGLLLSALGIAAILAGVAAVIAAFHLLGKNEADLEKARADRDRLEVDRMRAEIDLIKTKAEALTQLASIKLGDLALNKFAEGLKKIAGALKELPDEKLSYLKELNNLGNISADISAGLSLAVSSASGVPLEVNTNLNDSVNLMTETLNSTREIMTQISTTQKEIITTKTIEKQVPVTTQESAIPRTIHLKLEGPVNIDGANLGKLIYNGAAYYHEQRERGELRIAPSTTDLANGI